MLKEVGVGVGLGTVIGLIWLGFNIYPILFFVGILFLLYKVLDTKGGIKEFSSIKKGNSKLKKSISFDDIGGQHSAKNELLEALEFIRIPEKISLMGIRPLKGILLEGPPGTGKTLLAKAAASYTDSVFLSAAGSEFIEMYAGVGAQRVRQIFQQARNSAKKKNKSSAIIFVDEIEILGSKRGSHSSHHEYDQTLNQLLVEMDGISLNDEVSVLLIGATNRADLLDNAILRPGRFDRIVQVDLPDLEGRMQILQLHTRNKPLEKDINLESIAAETFGFSGAHLESLANEAAISALRDKSKLLKKDHFYEAIDKVIMGAKLDKRPGKDECLRIAIHEMGHALVSECIKPYSIAAITIVPRGKAMGFIRQKPEKDSYIYTKDFLEGQIAILLGGAVCEEELLGSRSTGAGNDFQQAIDLAKKIISSGMSSLGVVSEKDLPAGTLHECIKEILTAQEEKVLQLIIKYKDIIEKTAYYLIEKERINGNYLRELLGMDKKNEVEHEIKQ
jgi:cell division protease FtsH